LGKTGFVLQTARRKRQPEKGGPEERGTYACLKVKLLNRRKNTRARPREKRCKRKSGRKHSWLFSKLLTQGRTSSRKGGAPAKKKTLGESKRGKSKKKKDRPKLGKD